MANPTWSADNSTFYLFGGFYRFGGKGGRTASIKVDSVKKETEDGDVFAYTRFVRRVWNIVFLVPSELMYLHKNLFDITMGDVTPFHFSPTGAGASDSVLVRAQADYDPTELETPIKKGGVYAGAIFRFEYTLTEEFT